MLIWPIFFLKILVSNTFTTMVLLMSVSLTIILMFANFMKVNKMWYSLFNTLSVLILYFFMTYNIWKFFLIYEATVLPMMLLIMGWGTNPSRFKATFYFMSYTVIFSLPILAILFFNWKLLSSMNMNISATYVFNYFSICLFFTMFFVKVPIYFFHYWLPKAHVEASTFGSIILASALLKMGTLGFMKILIWLKITLSNFYFIFSTLLATVLCMLQTDIKKLIAMMSVVHMSISIASLSTFTSLGFLGFLLENSLHTVSSSMMFYFAGLMVAASKTRLLYFSSMCQMKFFTYLLLLMLFVNMGIPPFFSMMSEMMIISSVYLKSIFSVFLLMFYLMLFLVVNIMMLNLFKIKTYISIKLISLLNMTLFMVISLVLWVFNKMI